MVRALSPDPDQRFSNCRSFADTFLDGLRNRTPVAAIHLPVETDAEDGTREFDQVEYREQLQRKKPEDKSTKRLFGHTEIPANEKDGEVLKRKWQRWLVDLSVSLAIGFGALVVLGIVSECVPEDSSKPFNYRTPWIFGLVAIVFVGSFVWRIRKAKRGK